MSNSGKRFASFRCSKAGNNEVKVFTPLYDKVMEWSKSRHAEKYLCGVSFVESSFFPVPTSLMLAPMVLARPERAWWLAFISTMTSVAGGVFGYLIGYFLFDQVGNPIIEFYHLGEEFIKIKDWFDQYGIWLVFIAGITPIPYKLFTIAAGVLSLTLFPFILASLVGRASQFFLVSGLIRWGGVRITAIIDKWIEWIGWSMLVLAAVVFMIIELL